MVWDRTYLIDVAEDGLLNNVVLDDLTEDTAITTTDDEDLLGAGVGVHGEVGDHLLVGELVTLGALDDVVEDEDVAMVSGLEDQDILIQALLVVEDLLDLEGHGLAGPHVGDLAEPAICLVWLALLSLSKSSTKPSPHDTNVPSSHIDMHPVVLMWVACMVMGCIGPEKNMSCWRNSHEPPRQQHHRDPPITVPQDNNKTPNVPLLLFMIAHTICHEVLVEANSWKGP